MIRVEPFIVMLHDHAAPSIHYIEYTIQYTYTYTYTFAYTYTITYTYTYTIEYINNIEYTYDPEAEEECIGVEKSKAAN